MLSDGFLVLSALLQRSNNIQLCDFRFFQRFVSSLLFDHFLLARVSGFGGRESCYTNLMHKGVIVIAKGEDKDYVRALSQDQKSLQIRRLISINYDS